MNALRPSLLPGLLDSLRHNISHKNHDVALFEVGRVFALANGQAREERRVALALTGQRHSTFWSGEERHATRDIFDLKGLLEEFLEQFGVRGLTYMRRQESTALYIESAVIQVGKQPAGEMGQLLPALARQLRFARCRGGGRTQSGFAAGAPQPGKKLQAIAGVSGDPP